MFKADVDFLGAATRLAVAEARKDRDRFVPVLRAVESFLSAGKDRSLGVVGNEAGTELILRSAGSPGEIPLDMYFYTIYAAAPLYFARQLVDVIFQVDPEKFTLYTVMVPRGRDLIDIVVNQRPLVRVLGLPFHRGVSVFDMLAPDMRPAMFSNVSVPCMAPEVQLAGCYMYLSSLPHASSWVALLEQEQRLRKVMIAGFRAKLGAIFEGGRARGKSPARAKSPAHESQGAVGGLRSKVMARIWSSFVSRAGTVLVATGPSMQVGLGAGTIRVGSRPACLTADPFDAVKDRLQKIATELRANVHILTNNPQLTNDPHLRRMTAYLQVPGHSRDPLIDIYNAMEYDAVPFVQTSVSARSGEARDVPVRCGTLPVLGRFALVDLWTMQLLWRMKQVSAEFAKQQMRRIVRELSSIGNSIDQAVKSKGSGTGLFPDCEEDFFGRIENQSVAERRSAQQQRDEEKALRKVAAAAASSNDRSHAPRRLFPFYPGRATKSE